jgi:hypothetical protein
MQARRPRGRPIVRRSHTMNWTRQETACLCDILGLAHALERQPIGNILHAARAVVFLGIGRRNQARDDDVNAHFRPPLRRQGLCQVHKSGFRRPVHGGAGGGSDQYGLTLEKPVAFRTSRGAGGVTKKYPAFLLPSGLLRHPKGPLSDDITLNLIGPGVNGVGTDE